MKKNLLILIGIVLALNSNAQCPTVTVAPITRTMVCNGAPASFTAAFSPTTNVTGFWTDGTAIMGGPSSTSPSVFYAAAPGTYSFIATNNTNSCVTIQTVVVVSNTIVPTMTVSSPNGFTISCLQPSLGMNIISTASIAPMTYTWTNLTTSISTIPPTGAYTITVPGMYNATFSNGTGCRVSKTITVMIDTIRPTVSAITNLPGNSFTLSCYNSCLTGSATSTPTLSAFSYSWVAPPNLTIPSITTSICLANISSSASPTSYTVLAVNPNGCVGRKKIDFYKNTYVPPYSLVFTPSAITCANPCIAMSPSSTSTVPVTFTTTSPPPTVTATTSGALFCTPGTYTMTYTNLLNGCAGTTNTTVPINVSPPTTMTVADATLCSTPTVNISAGTVPSPFYTCSWTGPAGAAISSPTGFSTSVNMVGTYTVMITNTSNGCITFNYVKVVACTGINTLNALSENITIAPNPNNGVFSVKLNSEENNAEIVIYNALGQKVHSGKIYKGDNVIDVKYLDQGVYQFVIGMDVKKYTGKFLKE